MNKKKWEKISSMKKHEKKEKIYIHVSERIEPYIGAILEKIIES